LPFGATCDLSYPCQERRTKRRRKKKENEREGLLYDRGMSLLLTTCFISFFYTTNFEVLSPHLGLILKEVLGKNKKIVE
jgi:hypothetical protein